MLAAEQLERAAGIDVEPGLLLLVHIVVVSDGQTAAGDPVRIAAVAVVEQGGRGAVAAVDGGAQRPVAWQLLLDHAEQVAGVAVPCAPARRDIVRARQRGRRTVAVVERSRAPCRAARGHLLVVVADTHQGRVGDVGLQHAVDDRLLFLVEIDVRGFVLEAGDQPRADLPGGEDRPGHVGLDAAQAPASRRDRERAGEGGGWLFADQVDGRRGIARACHQPGGAANDLDPVIDQGVAHGAVAGRIGRRHAVHLEVGDRKTAGREVHAVGVVFLHGDASGLLQHVGDGGQVEVVHPLPGDHRDRLRGLAQGQWQLGRGCRRLGLVAILGRGHDDPFHRRFVGVRGHGARNDQRAGCDGDDGRQQLANFTANGVSNAQRTAPGVDPSHGLGRCRGVMRGVPLSCKRFLVSVANGRIYGPGIFVGASLQPLGRRCFNAPSIGSRI